MKKMYDIKEDFCKYLYCVYTNPYRTEKYELVRVYTDEAYAYEDLHIFNDELKDIDIPLRYILSDSFLG